MSDIKRLKLRVDAPEFVPVPVATNAQVMFAQEDRVEETARQLD
jgi:hypothetical protein